MVYKQDSLVFQVRILCYLQVESALLAIVLYASYRKMIYAVISQLLLVARFANQVLHKNTINNLITFSFQVTRFKKHCDYTLYILKTIDIVLINIV